MTLTLLVRESCELCEQFVVDFEPLRQRWNLPRLQTQDVDADAALARRHGLHVPVLLWDDEPIARVRVDPEPLDRLFGRAARSASPL